MNYILKTCIPLSRTGVHDLKYREGTENPGGLTPACQCNISYDEPRVRSWNSMHHKLADELMDAPKVEKVNVEYTGLLLILSK